MKSLTSSLLLFSSLFVLCIHSGFAQNSASSNDGFIILNNEALAAYKNEYLQHQHTREISALLAAADKTLGKELYSVTFQKSILPPSGNKHDFMSQAPYWWPDSSKPGGLPYIQKDGQTNPEIRKMKDAEQLGNLCKDVRTLSLAFYFSGKEEYAARAVQLMQTWFIDTATRMNPNMNYGQGIPGTTTGRGYGIISSRSLTDIPDAIALLQHSKSLNDKFLVSLTQWFKEYLHWLLDSPLGKQEASQKNNHGTFYDLQVTDISVFCGDADNAEKIIKQQTLPRVTEQFTPDGKQPLELRRTKSLGYSAMNLQGWTKLAAVAGRLHIDLWHYATADGKSISHCYEWLLPYLMQQKKWEYQQITPDSIESLLPLFNQAAVHYPDMNTEKMFALYPDFVRTPWNF